MSDDGFAVRVIPMPFKEKLMYAVLFSPVCINAGKSSAIVGGWTEIGTYMGPRFGT
jgi:hypothetical protein